MDKRVKEEMKAHKRTQKQTVQMKEEVTKVQRKFRSSFKDEQNAPY